MASASDKQLCEIEDILVKLSLEQSPYSNEQLLVTVSAVIDVLGSNYGYRNYKAQVERRLRDIREISQSDWDAGIGSSPNSRA